MAGKMNGAKGMAAAKMKHKDPPLQKQSDPPLRPPHKNPRSAHIREANGGYIMSAHGGDGDGMGADHVAPDMAKLMALMHAHMTGGGGVAEPGEVPEAPQDETAMEEQAEAEKASPVRKGAKKAPKKKVKIKLRAKSETY